MSGGEEEWMGGEELEGAIATLFAAFDRDEDGVSDAKHTANRTHMTPLSRCLCLARSALGGDRAAVVARRALLGIGSR